jgi:transcriptional regulator with XRE-family HTH domain
MTPATFKSIRKRAGLTQAGLASRLRLSDSRTIRRYEEGSREVSGPVSILMEMIDAGAF